MSTIGYPQPRIGTILRINQKAEPEGGLHVGFAVSLMQAADRQDDQGTQMTTLQRMLGIELPIIQAPMAGVQDGAPAIAVSNAGGLGSLPCAMFAADSLLNRVVSAAGAVRYPEVDASAARESAASRVGCAGGAQKAQ